MNSRRKIHKIFSLTLAILLVVTSCGWTLFASAAPPQETMGILSETVALNARAINFNESWKFARGNFSGAQTPAYDDSTWQAVSLPHDWSIYLDMNVFSTAGQTAGFFDGGIGWYRKSFVLPEEANGKRFTLDFDGSMMLTDVYVNGVQTGSRHYYGYTPFSVDITDALYTDGQANLIAVRVENPTPSARWYSGSGIYRDLTLTVTDQIYVDRDGTFVTTPTLEQDIAENKANVNVKTRVKNITGSNQNITLKTEIVNAAGTVVSQNETSPVSAAAEHNFEQTIVVNNPHLWSTDDPYLYTVVSKLLSGGVEIDRYETVTGFRYFQFSNTDGFSLNGTYMKLHGVCMHHDLGALGAAMNYRALERQMQIMKDMGVNSIRTSHNPAAATLIEICNKMGLTVMEEGFDYWTSGKASNDYSRYFNAHAEEDIKSMVNRDKNSPAVIIWSIGNEVPSPTTAIATNLYNWIREIDTTRPIANGENQKSSSIQSTILNNILDMAGLNYPSGSEYDSFRTSQKNGLVFGAETSSAIRSRGVYFSPNSQLVGETNWDTRQCSSYDNHRVSWGQTATSSWKLDRDRKFVSGQYVWTGFDYIGEPTPYWESSREGMTEIAKSSYFGIVDTAGFPKDTYYLYQSQWTETPMVHLLPHWNWTQGESVQVWAYSNADSVELFLDNVSLGLKSFVKRTTSDGRPYQEASDGNLYLKWDVPFTAGKLEAVARKDGQIVARDLIETADAPASVKLTPDRRVIRPDGKDLSFITVDIMDGKGTFVPTADNLVHFEVTGGEIAGVDNGNAISLERYQDNKRKAFSGKALLIVKSDGSGDPIRITATSDGLTSGTTTVYTRENDDGARELLELLPVSITGKLGNVPALPGTIQAVYSDNTEENLAVVWDTIPETLYETLGSFTVEGTVSGITLKAKASVTIIGVAAVESYSVVTPVGVTPVLPATVNLVYSNLSKETATVVWDAIDPASYAVPGTFMVAGTVAGTAIKASASIRVAPVSEEKNIALKANEPTATAVASYTNGDDDVNHLNDNIISYNNSPKNRWCNWASSVRRNDNVSIRWDSAHSVNKIIAYFCGNGSGSQSAATLNLAVQYYDESGTAQNVANLQQSSVAVPSDTNGYTITFTFDPVETKRIQLNINNPSPNSNCVSITEMQIPARAIVSYSTAELTDIQIDGTSLEGFNASTFQYSAVLPYDKENPQITATVKENARLTIVPPTSLPGSVKLLVTAEDGKSSAVYSLNLSLMKAPLDKAVLTTGSLSLTEDVKADFTLVVTDKKDEPLSASQYTVEYVSSDPSIVTVRGNELWPVGAGTAQVYAKATYLGETVNSNTLNLTVAAAPYEKVLVGFDPVQIKVDQGTAPVLPATVTANYDQGLSRGLTVTWDTIPPAAYNTVGKFTVSGTVQGTTLRPVAEIEIKGVVAAQTVSVGTILFEKPSLPDEILVYYSDGTDILMPVVWDAITEAQYGQLGTFTVEGTVSGLSFKPKATIRVTDQYDKGEDVSISKYGYTLPRVEAQYTCATDDIRHINDDIVSYNETPKNRWTNWKSTPDTTSWISFVFGLENETAYYLDEATMHFFFDPYAVMPASVTIQAWDGTAWVNVQNQTAETIQEITSDGLGRVVKYSFKKTLTSRIRFYMIPQTGLNIAITEIKMLADKMVYLSSSTLTDLRVNGQTIENFDPATNSYIYYGLTETPEVTALAADNAAVTIVPIVGAEGTARVIVTSEDGAFINTYQVQFVQNRPVDSVALDEESITLNRGESKTLTATVSPANAADLSVAWTSSDAAVVEVNEDGTVTAKGKGTAIITVTTNDGAKTSSCAVKVKATLDYTAHTGDTVSLPITLDDCNKLAGLSGTIAYDESLLTLQSISPKVGFALFSSGDSFVAVTKDGMGLDGTVIVGYVVFTVKADLPDDVLTYVTFPTEAITAYDQTTEIVHTEISSIALTIMGVPPMAGDVNLDGVIDLADAIMLMQYVSGSLELTPKQLKAADVNTDGAVNVGDVIIIMQMCLD